MLRLTCAVCNDVRIRLVRNGMAKCGYGHALCGADPRRVGGRRPSHLATPRRGGKRAAIRRRALLRRASVQVRRQRRGAATTPPPSPPPAWCWKRAALRCRRRREPLAFRGIARGDVLVAAADCGVILLVERLHPSDPASAEWTTLDATKRVQVVKLRNRAVSTMRPQHCVKFTPMVGLFSEERGRSRSTAGELQLFAPAQEVW